MIVHIWGMGMIVCTWEVAPKKGGKQEELSNC